MAKENKAFWWEIAALGGLLLAAVGIEIGRHILVNREVNKIAKLLMKSRKQVKAQGGKKKSNVKALATA